MSFVPCLLASKEIRYCVFPAPPIPILLWMLLPLPLGLHVSLSREKRKFVYKFKMMGQENESGKRKIGGPKCSGNGYME
jgi:hypothetical protein